MDYPTDALGESFLDHLANAVTPVSMVCQAPSLFTPSDIRDVIDGAMARLAQARALVPTGEPDA